MSPIRVVAAALAALLAAPTALTQGFYVGPQDPPAPQPLPQPAPPPTPPHILPGRPPAGPAVTAGLLQVRARIQDGAAATEVEQTLHNRTGVIQEGTWILPLPPGAVADRFTMTINGVEQKGDVLDASAARQVYENIVRRQRDPGLLEYLGHGCLRARVFPIPANGEVLVKVRWAQVLPQSGTFREWRYPVRAAFLGGIGPSKLTVTAEIHSRSGIKSVYSPFAGLDIRREGEHRAIATLGLESGQVPPHDLQLLYGVSEQDFGCHVLTHRPAGRDGWFLMMLSPRHEWPDRPRIRRAVTFVIDTSGSMAGEKIEQARGAARSFLASLGREDFFNVIPFSSEARPFFDAPMPAAADHIKTAIERIAALEARSGTNIEDAMARALGQPMPEIADLVPITVFLTDGLPTVGTTDINTLLAQIEQRNAKKGRVFAFGVGHDVNTRLLDTIAERTRGDRDYVLPGENIEVKAGALFAKLSGPVLTEVEVRCEGIEGYDLQPNRTPDMFVGTTLTLVGRYKGAGQPRVVLRGRTGGELREYTFTADFPDRAPDHDWLPALWAQKKIAFLMDQIRVHGQNPELVEEITRLGKEHGIVTPYTSHLIVEEGQQLAQRRGFLPAGGWDSNAFFVGTAPGAELPVRLRLELERAGRASGAGTALETLVSADPVAPGLAAATQAEADRSRKEAADQTEVGAVAVSKSAEMKALRSLSTVAVDSRSPIALTWHRIGSKHFHLQGGIWVDRDFRADQKDSVRKVAAFSDEYFALLTERPHLARLLAFSTRMVIVDGDLALEIE